MVAIRLPWRSASAAATAAPPALLPRDRDDRLDRLSGIMIARGLCDDRGLDRARRIADESGQRVDGVLIQLGLLTERGLASAYAELLDLPVATPSRFPAEPVLPERLTARFLRHARALPVAIEAGRLVIAVADPLDRFTPAAIASATGHTVTMEVAVPIDLEAAFERLYPDATEEGAGADADGEASEEDAERLRDIANEAPIVRLVNQLVARAAERRASDIHIEPGRDAVAIRYRIDGVLQPETMSRRGCAPP